MVLVDSYCNKTAKTQETDCKPDLIQFNGDWWKARDQIMLFAIITDNYSTFHVTWTTFKFSRNQLGMVLAYVM